MLTMEIFSFQDQDGKDIPYIQVRKIQGDFDVKPTLTLLEWATDKGGLKTGGKVIKHYDIVGIKYQNKPPNSYILNQVNVKK